METVLCEATMLDIGGYSLWRVNEKPFNNKMRSSNLEVKNFHIHGQERGERLVSGDTASCLH